MTRKSKGLALIGLFGAAFVLAACEDPPQKTVQRGYRGVALEQVYSPEELATLSALNQVPEPQPPADAGGPKAGDVYQNVEVLQDLSVGEFARLMNAITEWVAPNNECTYCHEGNNFASDAVYTKKVARQMLKMTMDINSNWTSHVQQTGVTCYTCHRGQPVPQYVWFQPEADKHFEAMAGNRAGQNRPAESVALASLPEDPFTPFLLNDANIRVQGDTALPTGNRMSIKQTEWTYGLMTHMSESLGVNCTYCHNSRAWNDWEQSMPQRVTAWHGIRMVRDSNNEHMLPTTEWFPPKRLGPTGDVAKVNCTTCHQGVFKPLYGVSMLDDYPNLRGAAPGAQASAGDGEDMSGGDAGDGEATPN